MIHIEQQPFATNQFHNGVYTRKIEWQDELEIIEYPFTLMTTWDESISQVVVATTVTWTENYPPDQDKIEELIIESYDNVAIEEYENYE